MIKFLWRLLIGTVYAVVIYGMVMAALSVYVYLVGYTPEVLSDYLTNESMIDHYLGESWIYWVRGKHWLGEREIWVETICALIGVIGALLGRWPLTGRK